MLKFWLTNIIFLAGLILFTIFKYDLHIAWLIGWVALYSFILFLGSYFIGLNFYLSSVNTLKTKEKKLVLTFDDGPHDPNTGKVLDVLKKHDVKAMFCIIGKNITGNESILERMVREGHVIANHSYSHATWFDVWSTQKVKADIGACKLALETFQPNTVWFRPPYGVTNPNIARAVRSLGLTSIGWNIRSYDTSIKDIAKIRQRILNRLKPGAIILLHDRLDMMPELLDELIPEIKKRGYLFTIT